MQKNNNSSRYKSHWHCVYYLKYRLVLVTKNRRKCLTKVLRKRLEEICREQCNNWSVELSGFNCEADHVQLLLELHPNITPSRFVNSLKTVTSRLLRKEFSGQLKKFYKKPGLWTRAYCLVTTTGAPLSKIKQYIRKQGGNDV